MTVYAPVSPEELAGIRELEAKGIQPTPKLVEEWLAAGDHNQGENRQPEAGTKRAGDSDADQAAPRRKRGRPPIEPPWYEAAAKLVAYGTPLRQALWRLGIQLTERQRQNVYRHVAFRRHYERYRHQFILEDYGKALPSDADRIWKMVSEF